jgi:hypothetical protein
MEAAVTNGEKPRQRGRTTSTTTVASLELLVGAHPDALRDIYASGAPADPTELRASQGRLLAIERFAGVYALTRPLTVALSRVAPWRGKTFEPGGTSGRNIVAGRPAFRFACAVADSELDGRPTLAMRYEGLGNPAVITRVLDELRVVGDGIALGVSLLGGRHGYRPLWWWGLESA